ncbi:MAG: PhzF family phenazine biosynthesis protein [Actinomycetota bacterium]|nr:PhzF family phenazine biosynthesis protein [Actinomycetota bacterium]
MGSPLRYRVVDVFTERPLEGNSLCVVLDPCPPELMPKIAREANLSETTFPVQTGPSAYEMRIFTPIAELPFAGHPSLGTAWLLGMGRWTQTTTGGTVIVEADERGATMTQPRPEFERVEEASDEVLSALGLSSADAICRSTAGGTTHVLVATSERIDQLDPDPGRVAEASRSCGALSLVPFRATNKSTLHARVFAPAVGVVEDPGSGSAAGPVGLLARELWGTHPDVTITMGAEIGRPCRLEVQTAGDLRVGGRVVLSAEGHFRI